MGTLISFEEYEDESKLAFNRFQSGFNSSMRQALESGKITTINLDSLISFGVESHFVEYNYADENRKAYTLAGYTENVAVMYSAVSSGLIHRRDHVVDMLKKKVKMIDSIQFEQ